MLEILEAGMRQGLLLAPLSIGIYISFGLLRYPDLTPDASFLIGSSLSTTAIMHGISPHASMLLGCFFGGCAGVLTGVLSEFARIDRILSGIAVTLLSYSLALRVLGKGNVSIPDALSTIYPAQFSDLLVSFLMVGMLCIAVIAIAYSKVGLRLRATGENLDLVRQLGGNSKVRILLGLFWANLCVGFSGALFSQSQEFTDVGQGTGTLFIGLACVLVGNMIPNKSILGIKILSAGGGSVLYSTFVSCALWLGVLPGDLKALSAIIVIATTLVAQKLWRKGESFPLFG